jgi:arabinan endo-1,5-alpha-L-arabinosidase
MRHTEGAGWRKFRFSCWVAIALLWPALGAAQTGAVRNVHDPVVVKEGGMYYLFHTGNGISMKRSQDLVHWEDAGRVFDEAPAWTFEAVPGFRGHIWAPDIAKVNDKYYLYYSISTFARNTSAIGLAVNATLDPASPNYRWEDRGKVVASTPQSGWNAIDPNLVADGRGNYYLSWGSFWTGIQMTRIDAATGKAATDPPQIVHLARQGPDNGLIGPRDENSIEAPLIVRRGDFYYLFVSIEMCCRGVASTYKIAVGRSRDVTGPYVDRDFREMREGGATLVLAGYGDVVRGPGHCAILEEGGREWLFHHMYDATTRRGTPTLQIRPLRWSEDGWPVAGAAIEAADLATTATVDAAALTGDWTVWTDFKSSHTLTLEPNGGARLENRIDRWQLDGDGLLLQGSAGQRTNAQGSSWRLFVGPRGDWLSGRLDNGTLVYAERR